MKTEATYLLPEALDQLMSKVRFNGYRLICGNYKNIYKVFVQIFWLKTTIVECNFNFRQNLNILS